MSRQHDALLKRICGDGDTLERARAILHTASIKTAPGSGYDLGQGASGLPAICACLAAEQTGDGDITEKTAQVASCLKPRLFKTTLHIVRSALAAAQASTAQYKTPRNVTYKDLVDAEKIGRKGMVIEWMQSAEQTLMKNSEMRRRFSRAYDAITVAVFCWTTQQMGRKVDPERLRDAYDVPQDMFDELVDALHEVCKDVAKIIKAEVAALRVQRTPSKTSSPSKANTSPSKQITLPPPLPAPVPLRALTRSPSKSSLRAPSVELSPTKTPSHKRKVAFDGPIAEEDEEDFDALATPSKRQKFSSPMKEMLPSTSSPRSSARLASIAVSAAASRATQETESRDSNPFAGPSTPRRPRTTPSQPSSTHSTRSIRSSRSHTTVTGSAPSTPSRRHALPTVREEPEVPRRRFRPVFADQQQWLKGDARLERELRPWAEKWRNLVKKAGGDVWKAAALGGGPVTVAS
ncbi:hypothetical protein C8Q80DRAFT_1266561 [Daedaleopsis nitida]|nr:hypothetical protein C8Q80DRAFT_1266561 [Daedaleopsis nitida]